MGMLLQHQGEYGKAEPFLRDCLDMRKKLYPPDKYPNGHSRLASSLNNLGLVLQERGEYGKAEPFYRDALDMKKRLYPPDQYPDGHPSLVAGLSNLGNLLEVQGQYGKAEPFLRDALDMCQKLYPTSMYPDGHPDLAVSLRALGSLLTDQGEYSKAEPYYRNALEMNKRLFPSEKYPDGHPDLAASLGELGEMLRTQGDYGKAEPFVRDSLHMYKVLYPANKYPDGHRDLAAGLSNLGALLEAQGEYGKAEPFYRDALDMHKKLYPTNMYPDGHPELALSLYNMGGLLLDQGDYSKAEPLLRDALTMYKHLYPANKYPDGHPNLARSINSLGFLLQAQGEYAKATNAFAEGVAMYDCLAAAFADIGAESEALNLNGSTPGVRFGFLAATAHMEGADPAEHYPVLWHGKSALARALERRRRLLRDAVTANEEAREDFQKLLEVRQDLASLILAPTRRGDDDRTQLLKDLSDQKERLEKKLAALLPASERETPPYTDLADRLPAHAAFMDLYWYPIWDAKTHKWGDIHYAAFVLRKGQPIRRVELSGGAAIEKDLTEWRDDIAKGFRSDAAGRLRKNIWEPIAKVLGDDVNTVYICPDVELTPCLGRPCRVRKTAMSYWKTTISPSCPAGRSCWSN